MKLSLVGWASIRVNDLDEQNIVPGSKVTVYSMKDNTIVNIYKTEDINDPELNPFYSDSVGDFNFWIEPGFYRVTVLADTELVPVAGERIFEVKGDNQVGIGLITNYLNSENSNFGTAFTECCLDNHIVDLEGLTLSTSDNLVISSESKVKEVRFNGATITVKSSSVEWNCDAPRFIGPGTYRGGSLLKQVNTETASDTRVIKLNDVDDLEVGMWLNSSLDIYYLPNATDRVGYIAEGDYNKITNIDTLTNEVTLTYDFLRTADYTVSSGIIKNAWMGVNTTFNSGGNKFNSPNKQDIYFENLTLENWAGYIIFRVDPQPDINDVESTLTLKGCITRNQFLDIYAFRGRHIICDNYKCERQYDFAKQHFVFNMPTDGSISLINGCDWARQNLDGEFYNSGVGIDPIGSSGRLITDGSNVFDAKQPTDLPTSDFSPVPINPLFFGINVPIYDGFYFYLPVAANVEHGGFISNGDKFTGYSRHIFGTSFNAKTSFSYDVCEFNGSETSCSPVFIDVTGKGTDQLRIDNKLTLNGGRYRTRISSFSRGVSTTSYNAKVELLESDRDTPQVGGFANLNDISMSGGLVSGRFRIESSRTMLSKVHVAYQGTSKPENILLFSDGYASSNEDINLILDVPEDFENTGLTIDDWNQDIPEVAWFGSNASNISPSPSIKFKIDGRDNIYQLGNNFSRRYFSDIKSTRSDINPFPTKGKFSARFALGDTISGQSDRVSLKVNDPSHETTTINTANAGDVSTINVALPSSFNPTHVALYSTQFGEYFYYTVSSVSANDITVNETIQADFVFGDLVYLFSASSVPPGLQVGDGCLARRDSNVIIPNGVPYIIPYETTTYDDSSGEYFSLTPNPERLTVPSGHSRVDLSGYIQFTSAGVSVGSESTLRIEHFNSLGTKIADVSVYNAQVGYFDHRVSINRLALPVNQGDYFVMKYLGNSAASQVLSFATLTIRKAR